MRYRSHWSASWFRGGVVAYATDVKHDLLEVPPGPVVSARAAEAMATNVAEVLQSSVSVAVTGVGGPEPQDGEPVGTVWFAISCDGRIETVRRLPG